MIPCPSSGLSRRGWMERINIERRWIMITYKGEKYYFDAAVALMDDELRDELAVQIDACFEKGLSRQKLFDEYCLRHKEKFNEEFVIE